MDDKVLAFRNQWAESGIEYTPDQAEDVLLQCERTQRRIKRQARRKPESLERMKHLTLEEKQVIRMQLAEKGKEVTLEELDGLISITLRIYEEEKL